MRTWHRLGAALAALAVAAAAAAQPTAQSMGKRLRIVGGLAGLSQFTRHEQPFWNDELARLSGGSFSAEIVPQDRAGIRNPEMHALVQTGVVPLATMLMSGLATRHPDLAAPDLAGLNPDIDALRRHVAAFRPHLAAALRERLGIELLAIYTYPAQVVFCNQPFAGLRGLAGRRIRTVSPTQADFVAALGARPVAAIALAEILSHLRGGNIDCAITGTMSGNTIGLHEHATHLHTLPVTWGLSLFVAHGPTWAALDPALKVLLRRELPRLEARIWDDADRETGAGVACNVGAGTCSGGRQGRMSLVASGAEDERLRRELFGQAVLPRFVERCGADCALLWNRTLAPIVGVEARGR